MKDTTLAYAIFPSPNPHLEEALAIAEAHLDEKIAALPPSACRPLAADLAPEVRTLFAAAGAVSECLDAVRAELASARREAAALNPPDKNGA